ncbi:MAG: thioesterase family protein [Bacteroidetes bacterium]|nr:thioesterase family protein [Bacteroidota bacterium]
MKAYSKSLNIRWSDLDPNFHLRHSVYYDFGAYCRVSFLEEFGLTHTVMQELKFGPILFREEAVFRREVLLGDELKINLRLTKARKDFSRWSIRHEIFKNSDKLAAVITVDGAWINLVLRKLATPPAEVIDVFSRMEQSVDFEWLST